MACGVCARTARRSSPSRSRSTARPDDGKRVVMSNDEAAFTRDELLRYSRHLALPEVGLDGQARLKGASVLIVGAGGLGSPAALYLAAAGIGRLGLVDFDRVDASNLQRQVLYTTADVGASKALVAARKLQALNPDVDVRVHEA